MVVLLLRVVQLSIRQKNEVITAQNRDLKEAEVAVTALQRQQDSDRALIESLKQKIVVGEHELKEMDRKLHQA